MTTVDYTWDDSSPTGDIVLEPEWVPHRVALTSPQAVFGSERDVLLVDPHPTGTWHTWMFPYASLIMDVAEIEQLSAKKQRPRPRFLDLAAGDTLRHVSESLRELVEVFKDEYDEALEHGINNIIPDLATAWIGAPFYVNYSLKFSKTSNSYTAYIFSYLRHRNPSLSVPVPHRWTTVDELQELEESGAELDGREVSSNVLAVVSSLRNTSQDS